MKWDRYVIPVPALEVAKGIFRIGPLDTKSRTPWTSPFLVKGEEWSAILEPGEGGQAPELLEVLKELGQDLDRIAYLISTHVHLHHVHAVQVLLPEMPRAKVVVHHRGAPHLIEPSRLNEGTTEVWGEGCPQLSPVPEDRVWAVKGGEVIDLGGRELEIHETLGHCPHHMSVFDRLTRTLFPGDAIGAFFAGPGFGRARPDILPPLYDPEKSLDSIRRLRALKPERVFVFGHNAASHSPDQTMAWAEEDITSVVRIVRDGMKQKMSSAEIGRQVMEYYDSVGIGYSRERTLEETGGMPAGTAPIGLVRFLMRQDPSLEMPK